MKLLLATDAWTPQTNGVVTTFKQVIPELGKMGASVEVIHPGLFKTWPLPSYPEIRIALNSKAIQRELDNRDFDAIHIATEGPIGFAVRRWCLRRKRPFTTSLHTKFPEYIQQRTKLPLRLGYAYLRRFHEPATTTLVTTPTQVAELSRWGLTHLTPWGRGVDTELFRPSPTAGSPGNPGDNPILLYVGRIAVEKNIEAFLQLPNPGPKWVVGDGPARRTLEAKYPEANWFGYRYGHELASLYAAADVFVFPSHTDTFGLVMLEAMACGTPVAAYPVAGPIDVVQPGRTGALNNNLSVAVAEALTLSPSVARQYAITQNWQTVAQRLLQAAQQTAIPPYQIQPA